jgi:hypothetical protein
MVIVEWLTLRAFAAAKTWQFYGKFRAQKSKTSS